MKRDLDTRLSLPGRGDREACATSGHVHESQWGLRRKISTCCYLLVTLKLFGGIQFSFVCNETVLTLKMTLVLPSVSISLVTFGQLDTFEVDHHSFRGYVTVEIQFYTIDIYLMFRYAD
jgi:hypothetical protein